MKKIIMFWRCIFATFSSYWVHICNITNSVDAAKFKIQFADDTPDEIVEGIIFIVQDGNLPESLAFQCPCGCKAKIILNLLPDASPKWSYIIDKKGLIDIYPSIWRKIGCKSHFFVRKSDVNWV